MEYLLGVTIKTDREDKESNEEILARVLFEYMRIMESGMDIHEHKTTIVIHKPKLLATIEEGGDDNESSSII